jgi:hypothetical protein
MTDAPPFNPSWDTVDEASDESFPASDPPAHGGTTWPVEPASDPPAAVPQPGTRRRWPWVAGVAALALIGLAFVLRSSRS